MQLDQIQDLVCQAWQMMPENLWEKGYDTDRVEAQMMFYYIAKEHFHYTPSKLVKHSGRVHSEAIRYADTMRVRLRHYADLQEKYRKLKTAIR